MRDSPYFLESSEKTKTKKSILSYEQKTAVLFPNICHTCNYSILKLIFQNNIELNNMKAKAEFNWSLMPAELQIANRKRKTDLKLKKIKKTKSGNIEDRLKQLEEKERNENGKEMANKNNSDSEQEMEDEEVADDEMDDENDYGNSYFDNGEAYNEEDDNLDDGPVY